MSECHNDQATATGIQQSIAKQNGGKTLELPVIYAWLAHECQSFHNPTNPLNITTSGNGFSPGNGRTYKQYGSLQEGYDATASWILHSGYYGGIVSTMAPAGQGDAIKQAHAIQASPWDGSYPGLDTQVEKIITLSSQFPSWLTANAAPINPDTGTSVSATVDQWNNTIACVTAKHPTSAGHQAIPIDASWIPDIITCAGTNGIALTAADIQPFVGKSMSDLRDGLAAQGTIPPADVGKGIIPNVDWTGIANLAPGLTKALGFLVDPQNWLYMGALGLGLYFSIRGYQRLGT